jgi:hypothetical protein
MDPHELEAGLSSLSGVAKADESHAVAPSVDDVAQIDAQADLLHEVEVADEHRVLKSETVSPHRGVHPAEAHGIADVVGDEIALASHGSPGGERNVLGDLAKEVGAEETCLYLQRPAVADLVTESRMLDLGVEARRRPAPPYGHSQ